MKNLLNRCFFAASVILGVVSILGSATAPPSSPAVDSAYYGNPASAKDVENFLRSNWGFFDPYSAIITCYSPDKGYISVAKDVYEFGWLHACSFNAKNRLGAFTGVNHDFIFSKDGVIKKTPEGTNLIKNIKR